MARLLRFLVLEPFVAVRISQTRTKHPPVATYFKAACYIAPSRLYERELVKIRRSVCLPLWFVFILPATPTSLPRPPSPLHLTARTLRCGIFGTVIDSSHPEPFAHPACAFLCSPVSVQENCPESASSLSYRLFVCEYFNMAPF